MSAHEFLTNVTIIVAMMGLGALLELAVPLFSGSSAERGRRRANLGMMSVTLIVNWVITSSAAVLALTLSLDAPGRMAQLGIPMAAQIAGSIAVLDFFFGYLAHRAMHLSPPLWRVHRVHHSDPFVDVTTTYRTHPIEVLWRFLFMIVPVWILGIPAAAVVIYRLLSAINGIFEHANIRLWQPVDSALSLILVTPNMHKVHHSRDSVETDSNYGNILSIHDRLLRTFTPTPRAFSVTYGLDDADLRHASSFLRLLSMPFRSLEPPAHKQIAGPQESPA